MDGKGGKADRENFLLVVRGDMPRERVRIAVDALLVDMPDSEPGHLDVALVAPVSASEPDIPTVHYRRVNLADDRASLVEIGSHIRLKPDRMDWHQLARFLDGIDNGNRVAEIPDTPAQAISGKDTA